MKKSSSVFALALAILGVLFLGKYAVPENATIALKNGQPTVEGIEVGEFLKAPLDQNTSLDLVARASGAGPKKQPLIATTTSPDPGTPTTTPITGFFTEDFSSNSVEESSPMSASISPSWWVNSGAWLRVFSGIGNTVQGELLVGEYWQKLYLANNPTDTDGGIHPQNIFRLVQRALWQNFTQEVYFKINKNNLSTSPNRNASNGLLLFNRYQDGDNLYYTGLRVDGAVVIKKKINKVYYTMAYKPFISSGVVYNVTSNPNLLPLNTWIGLKSQVKTNTDGTVTISLYVDINKTGNWVLALSALDNNSSYGGSAITKAGYAGIRTDFMDVSFDDFSISSF